MAKAKQCSRCEREAVEPQTWERHVSVPYKQQGWVGDQFIPYDRKYKGWPKIVKETLCGNCFAWAELDTMKQGGKDVTELEAALLELATKQLGAHAKSAWLTNTNPENSPTILQRKAEGNGWSPYNAATVVSHLACACEPYQDVRTYGGWREAGMSVQRGAKGIPIPVGARTTYVFCRCQIKSDERRAA